MRESIFFASIRAFFVALLGMAGVCLGLIFAIIMIASMAGTTTTEDIQSTYSVEIQPNAEGVRKSLSKEAPVILTLDISGIIGADTLTMHTIQQQLVESREGVLKDDRVKAILLYINTPGGTVVDSDGIYRHIKVYKETYKIPVYAYVDGLCASGGMYVASSADKVFASDVSIIGSVGVLSPAFFNISQVLDKLGIQALTLSAGKDKDLMNPLRPWRPEEPAEIQGLINYYYNQFVDIVSSNRPALNKELLVKDYGAKVFNPVQAHEYGYIDGSGYSRNETMKLLLKAAHIEDDNYQVIGLKSTGWLTSLFKAQDSLFNGKIIHKLELTPDLCPELMNQYLYLYRPS